jgi:hypothetical protein
MRYIGRILLVVALAVVAIGLLGVRGSDAEQERKPAQAAAPAATTAPDPYPLASGTTPDNIRLVVFERSYSECASYGLDQLAEKYKAADASKAGVAAAVGRAWASYFRAGRDAAREGRVGCLQGAASS